MPELSLVPPPPSLPFCWAQQPFNRNHPLCPRPTGDPSIVPGRPSCIADFYTLSRTFSLPRTPVFAVLPLWKVPRPTINKTKFSEVEDRGIGGSGGGFKRPASYPRRFDLLVFFLFFCTKVLFFVIFPCHSVPVHTEYLLATFFKVIPSFTFLRSGSICVSAGC